MDKDVWDAWEDDAFFSVLRPIIARRESLNAIPEPQVQFVKEVEAMRLDVTGNFTEVGLEEEFYKAARNHKLVAAVETRDTFTKAKRKEFQKTLHDGFVERGKGVAWKLQGIAQLMSQSNTGDLTMREWFDQLSKQVEYVDSNKFLVELALKQGQSKDSTGNKTGDRNDRGKDRWKKDRISTTAAPGTNKDPSHDAGNNPNNQDNKSTNPKGTKDRPFKRCTGCGRTNHLVGDCAFAKTSKRHPNFNTTTKEWADSEFGEKWEHVTTTPPGPQKLLPFHWQLDPNDPTKAIPYEDPDIADLASRSKSSMKRGAGEDTCHVCTIDIPKYHNRPGIRKLIPMSIVCRGQEEIDTQALLDTGADGPNFVHSTLASQLVSSGIPTQPTNFRACSCFGECRTLTLRVVGDCKLNLPGNPYSYFLPNTSFTICDDLPYDVIIGIDTINEHRLLQYRTDIQTPDSMTGHNDWKEPIAEEDSDEDPDYGSREATNPLPPATGASSVVATLGTASQPQQKETSGWLCVIRTREERIELMNKHNAEIHVSEFLQFEPADSLNEKWDSLDDTLQQRENFSDPTYELPTQIEGSDRLKGRIKQLLEKYRE